jgi:multicomponent Na+:H+ antiporter subunit D
MGSDLPLLVLLPPLVGALLVPAIGLWKPKLAHPLTLVALAAYVGLAFALIFEVHAHGRLTYALAGWPAPVGIELAVDMLGAFVLVVVACIAALVAVTAGYAVRKETPGKEVPFFAMVLVLLTGLTGMAVTGDLFNLYVFFEVSSLGCYALMALGDRKAPVAAFRYLVQGTLGASLYLIGLGFVYVLTGTLNMADAAERLSEQTHNPAYRTALALMVSGVGLKMALFPLHLWLPDAYTHASSTATALVAPVVTKVSAYVLIRLLFTVFEPAVVLSDLGLGSTVAWMSAAGIVVGSVMAIPQKDAKRMLAYSSVAQIGYIGLGIGLGSPLALVGAMLHVLNHAVMKSCLFLAVGGVAIRTGARRIKDYAGLGRVMPWTFAAFALSALAMVGIPPTGGFFSKWYLILGAIEGERWVLVVVLVGSSLLTAVYFFRVLEIVFAGSRQEDLAPSPGEGEAEGAPLPLVMTAPTVLLAAANLALGLGSAWIVGEVLVHALPPGMELPSF